MSRLLLSEEAINRYQGHSMLLEQFPFFRRAVMVRRCCGGTVSKLQWTDNEIKGMIANLPADRLKVFLDLVGFREVEIVYAVKRKKPGRDGKMEETVEQKSIVRTAS